MANSAKAEVTKEDVAKAQKRWVSFTKLLTWGTLATIGGIILLALITL